MNILLTSAGRRTYMVEYFKKALNGKGLVFASNSCMSPALKAADGYFITPLIYDSEYIPFLLAECKKRKIDMIVSLFDADLPVLSKNRDIFAEAGVRIAISGPETIKYCNDKYLMASKLSEYGISCPRTFIDPEAVIAEIESGKMSFPVIIKPRYGMGSIGLYRAFSPEELKAACGMCRREVFNTYLRFESEAVRDECVIIQEIRQGSEYGLDVISDLEGGYITTIVRKKLAMRAGETDEAIVLGEDDREYAVLQRLGAGIARALGPSGLIDADVIMDEKGQEPYVIDINARFGGGYPFSHLAGADVPRAYVLFAEGRDEEAKKYLRTVPGTHGYKEIVVKA